MMKLCTKCERNRAIRGGVIAISVFDVMTLNIALRVALGSVIIFTKFELRQLDEKFVSAFGYLAAFSNASGSKLSDVENDTKCRTF